MSDGKADYRLDGRHALITGAGRGIGRATAVAFAAAGAKTTLLARTGPEIDELATSLRADGHSAETVTLDVTDRQAVAALFEQQRGFDILINNAGTNRPKPMLEVSEDDYDAIFDLNVRAAFFVAQDFARQLLAAGRSGSIVNVSSQMGHVGGIDRVAYCASKWAVEGMTKAMALEMAPLQIRVNAVAPTFIDTAMTARTLADPGFRAATLAKIPMGRLATPEEVASAILFLASDAAAMITGHSLVVDGGWTAQ